MSLWCPHWPMSCQSCLVQSLVPNSTGTRLHFQSQQVPLSFHRTRVELQTINKDNPISTANLPPICPPPSLMHTHEHSHTGSHKNILSCACAHTHTNFLATEIAKIQLINVFTRLNLLRTHILHISLKCSCKMPLLDSHEILNLLVILTKKQKLWYTKS